MCGNAGCGLGLVALPSQQGHGFAWRCVLGGVSVIVLLVSGSVA